MDTKPKLRFRDLKAGAVFRFAGEDEYPYSGMARGPWRKTGPRKYVHVHSGAKCRVGTINVEVIAE